MVRLLQSVGVRCCGALAVAGVLGWATAAAEAGGNLIRKLTLDESAPVVELFDGMESGQFQVKMSALSANEANVFIKNATDAQLTVAVPKAVVGVNILPQFQGPQGFFGNNQNQGLNQGANQGQNNQQGRSQSIGGQLQPFFNQQQGFPGNNGNGAGNGNNMPGQFNGFFSIPPEKTVQLKVRSVCLDYGLPDPHAGLKYELRRVESEISNPVLCELLERYSPRVDQQAMQAAAWHLSSKLNWNQVSHLPDNAVGALVGGTMFTPNTVKAAQSLVKQAEEAAKDRPKVDDPATPTAAPRKLVSSTKNVR